MPVMSARATLKHPLGRLSALPGNAAMSPAVQDSSLASHRFPSTFSSSVPSPGCATVASSSDSGSPDTNKWQSAWPAVPSLPLQPPVSPPADASQILLWGLRAFSSAPPGEGTLKVSDQLRVPRSAFWGPPRVDWLCFPPVLQNPDPTSHHGHLWRPGTVRAWLRAGLDQ